MRAPPSRLQRQPAGAAGFPYVWTTWLSKLLTGEASCEWAAWFKAHHQGWDRQPSDFDNVQWLIDHTALLAETLITFQESGRILHTEAQNSFRLEGATVTISGKPDLIITSASDPTYVLIIDVKTGQERPSHAAQLMIYLYALPKALQQYRDPKIRGEVFYPTRTHVVGRGSLDQGFIRRLVALIQRIAAKSPLRPPPARQSAVSATSQRTTAPTASTAITSPLPATRRTSDVIVVNKRNTTRPRTSPRVQRELALPKEYRNLLNRGGATAEPPGQPKRGKLRKREITMKKTLSAKYENGAFKPLDTEQLSIPEGAIVAIIVDDDLPWDDPRWMKQLLDDEEAEHYLKGVNRETSP